MHIYKENLDEMRIYSDRFSSLEKVIFSKKIEDDLMRARTESFIVQGCAFPGAAYSMELVIGAAWDSAVLPENNFKLT